MSNLEKDSSDNLRIKDDIELYEHIDLITIRKEAPRDSETYQRAKDRIEDIVGNTNNEQVGNLTYLLKEYKKDTDRNISSNHRLTIIAISIAMIALIFQIIDVLKFTKAQSEVKIIEIRSRY